MERRWRDLGDDTLALSVICEAELLYGLEWKQSTHLQSTCEQLLKNRLQVLSMDTAVAISFSQ